MSRQTNGKAAHVEAEMANLLPGVAVHDPSGGRGCREEMGVTAGWRREIRKMRMDLWSPVLLDLSDHL